MLSSDWASPNDDGLPNVDTRALVNKANPLARAPRNEIHCRYNDRYNYSAIPDASGTSLLELTAALPASSCTCWAPSSDVRSLIWR